MKTTQNSSLSFSLRFKKAALLLGLSILASPYAFSMGDTSEAANEGIKQMNHAQKEAQEDMREKQMQQEEELAPEQRKLERQSLEEQSSEGSGAVQWTEDGEEDLNNF